MQPVLSPNISFWSGHTAKWNNHNYRFRGSWFASCKTTDPELCQEIRQLIRGLYCVKPLIKLLYFIPSEQILQDVFPLRIHGIHLLNQNWVVGILLTIINPFLPKKIRNRVRQKNVPIPRYINGFIQYTFCQNRFIITVLTSTRYRNMYLPPICRKTTTAIRSHWIL